MISTAGPVDGALVLVARVVGVLVGAWDAAGWDAAGWDVEVVAGRALDIGPVSAAVPGVGFKDA